MKNKHNVSGSKVSGAFYSFGELTADITKIYLAEGYADAASIFESEGEVTLCVFGKDNFKNVVKLLRKECPNARIIIVGDNDEASNNAITEVCKAYPNTLVVFPDFTGIDTSKLEKPAKDVNDLYVLAGKAEVARQLALAAPLGRPTAPVQPRNGATPGGRFSTARNRRGRRF